MFVLTHKNKDDQLELSRKRKNSIKQGLERKHLRLEDLNVMCMYQSITDLTSHKGSSLLSSFWDMVYATTATEILEEFTSPQ